MASTSAWATPCPPAGSCTASAASPVILGICRDIREVAEPGCRLFNYANPMAMLTWAANDHGEVETIGLCHGVQGGHRQIAEVLGVPQQELDIIAAGINHQTWYVQLRHHGKDMTGELLAAYDRHPKYRETEKVRIDMLRRFGCYSTESNGHLSEYVPWYRKRPGEIRDWISLDTWIHGETGGYLAGVHREAQLVRGGLPALDGAAADAVHGGGAFLRARLLHCRRAGDGGALTAATSTSRTTAPSPTCPTTPWSRCRATWTAHGINIPLVGDLPLGCAAVCNASISVQRLAVAAAVAGDDTLLRQAMLLDPLVGAVATPPEVWQLVDDMLLAQRQWLPQYGQAIAAAEERLNSADRLPTREWEGAARLEVRSVEQLRAGGRQRRGDHARRGTRLPAGPRRPELSVRPDRDRTSRRAK